MTFLPDSAKHYWQQMPLETIQYFQAEPKNIPMNQFLISTVYALPERPRSILEIGAFTGERLQALMEEFPDIELKGIELNASAVETGNIFFAEAYGKESVLTQMDLTHRSVNQFFSYDLLLSWAVLMYVHPIYIKEVLTRLLESSNKYLLIIEPTSFKKLRRFFPTRNKAFLHNYVKILQSLGGDFSIDIREVPPDIWRPRFGIGLAILVTK